MSIMRASLSGLTISHLCLSALPSERKEVPTTAQTALRRHIDVLGIYDLQGLNYGRTELLVADMRLLAPDPSGTPRVGRCQ